MSLALALAPWALVGLFLAFGIRKPRPLSAEPGALGRNTGAPGALTHPSVTFIVPARNEERNIAACVSSLAAQRYPDFSIVVVDDRSTDGTRERALGVARDRARSIEVIAGEPLPEGWFGKPWACFQGARRAEGEILVFTDADTRHGPSLLGRAVQALDEDAGDAVTLFGEQEMGSFFERLLQPQVFALLGVRFRALDRPLSPGDAGRAIANGQYILIRRGAYFGVGGHEAVKGEVAEDLRLAQVLTAAGVRLSFRGAEDPSEGALVTRMYQSFAEIREGWTKNIAVGARQSAGWWSPVALPGIVGFLLFWMVPPIALAAGAALPWSALATLIGVLTWARIYLRFGVPVAYALLHPLGAALAAYIVLRSWVRGGGRIEWKGRRYRHGATSVAEGGA